MGLLFYSSQQNGYIQTDEYEMLIDPMRHQNREYSDNGQHRVKTCSIPKGTIKHYFTNFLLKKKVLSCKPLSQFKTSVFLTCFIFRIRDRLKQFGLYYE